MVHQLILLFLTFTPFLCYSQLDVNLLINSHFSQPDTRAYGVRMFQNISGWNCSNNCEIDPCYRLNSFFIKKINAYFLECDGQVLDINSQQQGTVSQIFQAQQGQHILHLEYFLPFSNSRKKTLQVYLNDDVVYTYHPIFQSNFHRYLANISVYPRKGQNKIIFNATGHADSSGFRLAVVEIKKIIDSQLNKYLDSFFTNKILENVVKFPGSRVILGELLNILFSFDRFQLYAYHNRQYSNLSACFIHGMSKLMYKKGSLSQSFIESIFPKESLALDNFASLSNYKEPYINPGALRRPSQGFGLIANNSTLVFYSLPFYVMIIAFFYILFRLTFRFRVSLIFRKYCFLGIMLLMICEGNIEQYAFFCLGELKALFCFTFFQKLGNLFVLLFSFLIIIGSTALYNALWIVYAKAAKHLIDGVDLRWSSLMVFTLDKGFFCLLLGIIHSISLSKPTQQLLYLGIAQALWIFSQLFGLSINTYQNSIKSLLTIVQGFLRIIFILSLHAFEANIQQPFESAFINGHIHSFIIYMFLFVWSLNFIIFIFHSIGDLQELIKRRYSSIQKLLNRAQKKMYSELTCQKSIQVFLVKSKNVLQQQNQKPNNFNQEFSNE